MSSTPRKVAYVGLLFLVGLVACEPEDSPPHSGNSGLAASAGASGAAGVSGTAGTAGSAGAPGGSAGSAGTAGTGGSGASGGTGGTGGAAGTGATAGSAGAGGTGASAGTAGVGGSGGSGGSAGSAGTGATINSISAAEVTLLPILANATGCYASGITSDGRKVIGNCTVQGPNGGQSLAVLWTDGVPAALPVLDALSGCGGIGTNSDATVLLGKCGETGVSDDRPVRWIQGGSPQPIDPFDITDGGSALFEAMSYDGTVLGGWVSSSVKYQRPALWSGGYNVLVEPGVVAEYAMVSSVSGDGTVAVGVAPHNGASQIPFRYEAATGVTFLATSSNWWSAKVSGDGNTVYVEDFSTGSGAVWTLSEGLVPIVGLGEPHAVNHDGRLMVGASTPYPLAWFDRQLLDLPALVMAGSGPVEPVQQGTLNAVTPDGYFAAGDCPSVDGIQRAFVLRFIP